MARIVRLRVCSVSVACLLWLGIVAAIGAEPPVAPAEKQGREAVEKWLDRAEQYAASLPERQLIGVLPILRRPMAAADKVDCLDRLLATINDPEQRAAQDVLVCVALAAERKYDAAIRRAQSLSAERRESSSGEAFSSPRVSALQGMVLMQLWAHNFAEAKKTIALINDPDDAMIMQSLLAEYQAKAGLYAEAAESLDKAISTSGPQAEMKKRSRQVITRYQTGGYKDPPSLQQRAYYELLRRSASLIFCDSSVRVNTAAEVEDAEQLAGKLTEGLNSCQGWREIAWAHFDRGNTDKKNLERCRIAVEKSLHHADKIPNDPKTSYHRSVAFASAASLYIDLGEIDLARQTAKKAAIPDFDSDVSLGICTTQILVATLVRVGDVDRAKKVAEKIQVAVGKNGREDPVFRANADVAWLAWATACTLEGRVADVERQLEKLDDARTKAVLCTGVAEGLLELRQRATGKTP